MKGALVTGAGMRVGRALAMALAADGFFVFVHYNRSAADARRTVAAMVKAGGKAKAVRADLSSARQAEASLRASRIVSAVVVETAARPVAIAPLPAIPGASYPLLPLIRDGFLSRNRARRSRGAPVARPRRRSSGGEGARLLREKEHVSWLTDQSIGILDEAGAL